MAFHQTAPPMWRLLPLALVFVAGCDSASDRTAYDVTFFDEGGAVVATGRLDFDEPVTPGSTVFGTYRLSDPGLTPNQRGRLRATCSGGPATDDDRLEVDVDLDVNDAGLSLVGGCVDGVRGGVWSRIFFGGGLPGGTFEVE